MIPLLTLTRAATDGLRWLRRQKDVRETELFVACNASLTARLNYTSHIPCNGVEEPKSSESYGVGLRAVFNHGTGIRIGFGSEAGNLSLNGVKAALEKARRGAVADPSFTTLPRPSATRRTCTRYHDAAAMGLTDKALVQAGWKILTKALDTFTANGRLQALATGKNGLRDLGLIVGGDVTFLLERMALGSTHLPTVQTDESTLITSFITAMVERENAKGTGFGCDTSLHTFKGTAGADAARQAIAQIGGVRIADGDYAVILGPQPVSDIMNHLVLPSLTVGSFYDCSSTFHGQLGGHIAQAQFSLSDHGALPGHMGSKGITCEGLPTGRTALITNGRLVGLLSNFYETERILRDPTAKDKLGVSPKDHLDTLVPRNGFRYGCGGGRQFDRVPSVSPTNVLIESSEQMTREALLQRVQHGIYIGRIWYTYPINGLRAGDFTATVVGDSYVIQDGTLAAPIKANTVRINDNIHRVLRHIIGMTGQGTGQGIVSWAAADAVVYAPDIAVSTLRLDAIANKKESR